MLDGSGPPDLTCKLMLLTGPMTMTDARNMEMHELERYEILEYEHYPKGGVMIGPYRVIDDPAKAEITIGPAKYWEHTFTQCVHEKRSGFMRWGQRWRRPREMDATWALQYDPYRNLPVILIDLGGWGNFSLYEGDLTITIPGVYV
jgi:hypothetical protein